jgi:formate dehydrogenase iron-sulfur subunit
VRVFVPLDASARSVGADAVADAIAKIPDVTVVRNGSRGLAWLEPMVEVEVASGRVAYGPVTPSDVPSLVSSGFLEGREHALRLGAPEEIPWLKSQERLTFARCGIVDPLDLHDYEKHAGFRGLDAALKMKSEEIVDVVTRSGLRGRGGAAFPTGIKWKTVLKTAASQKYVVCNADEGDSGTFSDRMIMEGDPFVLIEGMIICGLAVGATRGFVYLRSEYPDAERVLSRAIEIATKAGVLGDDVRGSKRAFYLELRRGAGSYVCGEETALLESLEGKRGEVRYRPPVPAVSGLFGMPTALNNVNTFASVPVILDKGADFYRDFGVGKSRGTVAYQLGGNVKRGGLVEKALGLTVRQLVYDYGGGTATGRPVRAVQIGGPLGAYLPESELDTPLEYEALAAKNALLGHAGVVVFDDTVDMARMARFAMEFCAIESCGKCTPCRIGSRRGVELIDKLVGSAPHQRARLVKSQRPEVEAKILRDLCDTMTNASLCALGGLTAYPVESALRYFPEDFGLPPNRR